MNEDAKRKLKISLIKRDGKVITSIPKVTPEGSYSRSRSAFDIAQELRAAPYQSEFIKFDPDCDRTLVENSETDFCVIYNKKDSETEIGRVLISGNGVSEVECYGEDKKYKFSRKEAFLKSGLLSKRQLLIYQKGNSYNTLIHFCYEAYRNGQMDFCATSINDLSISNGDGDFVRYIYNNGKVISKEVFSGKEYRFKTLSSRMYLPPVIYSKGGNLEIRYILGNSYIRKETNFKRNSEYPVMIVGSKNDLEKFVDLNSATPKFEAIMDLLPIMDGSSCRVHLQEQYFTSYMQNADNISTTQENNSQESNNYIEYNIETEQVEETLRNLKNDKNIVYGINVRGTLHLKDYADSLSLFTQFLQDTDLYVCLDLSECAIQNEKYLRFHNCFSLRWLALPQNMKHLKKDLFYKCNNLRYVKIPESISKIDSYAFEGCRDFKFSIGVQNISYKNLIYNKEHLESSSQFEVKSKNELYGNLFCDHQFDHLGFISLPKPFVNGIILTEQGKEFRHDVNLNITELRLLITKQAALIGSRIVDSGYADKFNNSKTGAEAIEQLMIQNNVEEKYKDVIINNIPVIPYGWRTTYLHDGIKQNPYINSLYENLVREVEVSSKYITHDFRDKQIQEILNSLAKNIIYRQAMWYLSLTKKTTVTAQNKDHLKNIIKGAILKNGPNCDLNFIDVSDITDMTGLFAFSNFNGDISEWDVSNVTNMEDMFFNSKFNGNINDWDVSNVKNMRRMFSSAQFNGDISNWNVNTSCSIIRMFDDSKMKDNLPTWKGFNTSHPISAEGKIHLQNLIYLTILKHGSDCDLNFIDVSNVKDMSALFSGSPFNGDISKWDVSNVRDMSEMFEESSFIGDISNWDVSNVTNMNAMFKKYKPQHNYFDESPNDTQVKIDISRWNVSNVRDMSEMFQESDFTGDISNWDVSNVTSMTCMFAESQFNNDISRWNVSKVTDMSGMFTISPFTGDIGNWDVSNVTDMCAMFTGTQFNGDVNKWNVSKVTDMSYMFAASAFNGDISQWDVSNVTDMSNMFEHSHFAGDIGNWNVSNVTDMNNMLCQTMFNSDISRWNVSRVNDFHCMFFESHFSGDVSHWIVSREANVENMFAGSELEDLGLIPNWYHARCPHAKEASDSFDFDFEDD